jgi:hypothetical protein
MFFGVVAAYIVPYMPLVQQKEPLRTATPHAVYVGAILGLNQVAVKNIKCA